MNVIQDPTRMTVRRLAVDFGTSNTVLATWDAQRQEGVALALTDLCTFFQQGNEQIPVIPSLIHYASLRQRWIGAQVLEKGLAETPETLRWMKRYILHHNPRQVRLHGREISHQMAGQDFLTSVLQFAIQEFGLEQEELTFTAPVEAFEYYEDWLTRLAQNAGFPRYRLIDEPSAAALGYGAHIQPGDVYLIFDFGGGTLDVSVILIELQENQASGRRCRVLGKAGLDLGGATLDGWLFQEVLRRNGRSDADEDVRPLSRSLLSACERAKEQLSFQEAAEIYVPGLAGGQALQACLTRADFEALLDQHELFTSLERTLRRALHAARERGYDEETIKTVLMVGGSSQALPIQRALRRMFGNQRVLLERPLDAVARGAAAFAAGIDFYDHIQHDYAIRYRDRSQGGYEYRLLVTRGTPYPTHGPLASLTIKAARDGQAQLGIDIFELGSAAPQSSSLPVEIIFDPSGAARLAAITPQESEQRARFWMNEERRTFLTAHPPARRGEARFEATFSIDAHKRLLITARDLLSGRLVLVDQPVVQLT